MGEEKNTEEDAESLRKRIKIGILLQVLAVVSPLVIAWIVDGVLFDFMLNFGPIGAIIDIALLTWLPWVLSILLIFRLLDVLEKRQKTLRQRLEAITPQEPTSKKKISVLKAFISDIKNAYEEYELVNRMTKQEYLQYRVQTYYRKCFGQFFLDADSETCFFGFLFIGFNIMLGFPPGLITAWYSFVLHAGIDASAVFWGLVITFIFPLVEVISIAFILFRRKLKMQAMRPLPRKHLIERWSAQFSWSMVALMPFMFFFVFFPTSLLEFGIWIVALVIFYIYDGLERFPAFKLATSVLELHVKNYSADLSRAKRAIAGSCTIHAIVALMLIFQSLGLYSLPFIFLYYLRPLVEKLLFRKTKTREEIHQRWSKIELRVERYVGFLMFAVGTVCF
ncbi:MAG: hypothetical protein ACXQS8_03990, partial [Candidatus Helarchaeales archaeon]